MKKRALTILLFVVVFGIPVSWYLFLQAFGENQFDLPRLGQWVDACVELEGATLVAKEGAFDGFPNQLKRVEEKVNSQKIIAFEVVNGCDFSAEMYLVDDEKEIRGEYFISREEVDRLLAEIDIYLLNERNGSTN